MYFFLYWVHIGGLEKEDREKINCKKQKQKEKIQRKLGERKK